MLLQVALPVEVSSFVDRVSELAEIERALSTYRVVTLTGVGGVGKTRLAVRAASAARPSFPDGVYLVDLSALPDPDLLPHAIATAFQLQDQTARPMSEVVAEYLAERRVLLVVDTAELHVQACAELLMAVLRTAPGVRVLVTSRQVLGLVGERVITVSRFTVGEPERGVAAESAALRLFAERAAEVSPGFALTRENEGAVARLCHRLDGIPLAIELASAWLRMLSVEQIEAALDEPFRLLKGRRPDAPLRHQTLQQAIGWSHQLCEPSERLMWTRLSCFPASFDLDATAQVCADGQVPLQQVPDLVDRLVDKSVLVSEQHEGHVRYRMLDTVREYGRDWLHELGERPRLARRHRDYYLRMAERAEADWFGPDQPQILSRLMLEHANLQAALEFSLTTDGEHREGLRLAGALWAFWISGGRHSEGRYWLDRALALDDAPSPVRTKALWANGYIATNRGELATATDLLQASREQALRDGDEYALSSANHRLGVAIMLSGSDPERSLDLLEQALAYHVATGNTDSQAALARLGLASAAAYLGRLDRATELAEELVSICEQHGELSHRSYTHYILALLASGQQQTGRALAEIRTCLPVMRTIRQLPGIAMTLELLALLRASSGDAATAAVLHGAAEQVWQLVGTRALGSRLVNETHVTCEKLAREALGEHGYEEAFRHGSEFDLDAAMAYAIRAAEPAGSNPG